MVSLSDHGMRGSPDPSRRGFMIAMAGAGVTMGYARSGLVSGSTGVRTSCSNRRSGTELIRAAR
jgi:hypothetical protein